ncbi:hypothetical protein L3Q82_008231 [Scortum barcoo]|uniref:Uncharacterized protein n=1 Tax=Scortum barcoo TaxID=214431 RepID=A0ACB8WH52_9TELE|nr:hypothetical protein L3Q82_008231 [Scortum barcoo]
MTHFIHLTKLPSAKEIASVMIHHVFRIHGLSTDIVSDRGPQFRFEFCQLLGATVSLSSGYHPESNGQTERLNQELETCLRCLVAQNQASWSDHLTWVEYTHNSLVHGYQPPLFPTNEEEVTVLSAHTMARRCRKIWAAARRMLLRGQERMKAAADRHRRPAPVYTPGQKVWLAVHEGPASPCSLQETHSQVYMIPEESFGSIENRMQSAGLALEELLVTAQKQDCLTVGIYESAKLLNAWVETLKFGFTPHIMFKSYKDPDSVVLCVLAADDADDVALQIHFTLLQSFCCDSGLTILRVSGVHRLQQLLGAVDANRNQEEHRDFHCMLVTLHFAHLKTALEKNFKNSWAALVLKDRSGVFTIKFGLSERRSIEEERGGKEEIEEGGCCTAPVPEQFELTLKRAFLLGRLETLKTGADLRLAQLEVWPKAADGRSEATGRKGGA